MGENEPTNIAAIPFDAGGGLVALAGGGWVFSKAPTMKKRVPENIRRQLVSWQAYHKLDLPIPSALINKLSFLPNVSTKKKTNIAVATTFTTP